MQQTQRVSVLWTHKNNQNQPNDQKLRNPDFLLLALHFI